MFLIPYSQFFTKYCANDYSRYLKYTDNFFGEQMNSNEKE